MLSGARSAGGGMAPTPVGLEPPRRNKIGAGQAPHTAYNSDTTPNELLKKALWSVIIGGGVAIAMCRWSRHLQGTWGGPNSSRSAIFISTDSILHQNVKSRKGFFERLGLTRPLLLSLGIKNPKTEAPPEAEIGSVSCPNRVAAGYS